VFTAGVGGVISKALSDVVLKYLFIEILSILCYLFTGSDN